MRNHRRVEELGWYIKIKQLSKAEIKRHLFGRELVLQEPSACGLALTLHIVQGMVHFYSLAHKVVHGTKDTNSTGGQSNEFPGEVASRVLLVRTDA